MDLNYKYWVFQKAFSEKFCDHIIKYGNMQRETTALVGGATDITKFNKKDINNLQKTRNSNIAWLNDKWIYREVMPFIDAANQKAGWNFDTDISEDFQFTKYKLNQHYDWHCDSFPQPFNKPDMPLQHGKIRKLSATISLSDPSSYSGGELEFNFNDPLKPKKQNIYQCKEILPRGSIVIFPSFVYHRVCPVTEGIRYSLVLWTLGKPYR